MTQSSWVYLDVLTSRLLFTYIRHICPGCIRADDTVTYLYKDQPRVSLGDLTTLVAGVRLRHKVTYLETLGPASCSSPVHCPLAGAVLIGDAVGSVKVFSESGDVAVEMDAPRNNAGAVRVARVLKFRQSKHCVYDVLIVAYFEHAGMYGVQIDYKDGASSGWQQLSVPSNVVVDMKMSRGKNIDGMFSIHSFLLLDGKGSVLYNKDLKLHCANNGRLMATDWSLRHVGSMMQAIHASVTFGAYMVSTKGDIGRIDRRTYEVSTIHSSVEDARIVQSSFDEISGEMYITRLSEKGLLVRSRLSKGMSKEIHRLQISVNVQKCMSLTSSGGLSLVSNWDSDGLQMLTLFNHSEHLVKKHPASWDAARFISCTSPATDIVRPLSLPWSDKIRDVLSSLLEDGCLTVSMKVWNRASLQVYNRISILSQRKDILLMYRPTFRSNKMASDSNSSSDTMHMVMGIFKSLALLVAASVGFRFCSSKGNLQRPTLGQQKEETDLFSKYRVPRSTVEMRQRQSVSGDMFQTGIDRAPDQPHTRVLKEDFWMD